MGPALILEGLILSRAHCAETVLDWASSSVYSPLVKQTKRKKKTCWAKEDNKKKTTTSDYTVDTNQKWLDNLKKGGPFFGGYICLKRLRGLLLQKEKKERTIGYKFNKPVLDYLVCGGWKWTTSISPWPSARPLFFGYLPIRLNRIKLLRRTGKKL